MLLDPYTTTSNPRMQRRSTECNVKEFYKNFEAFYHDFRAGKNPDLPHTICDPYGFALLCIDYEKKESNSINENISCEKSFKKGIKTEFDSLYKYKFPFKVLLDLLFIAYYFDYSIALEIYKMQGSAFDIFNQIMNGQGYVINKSNYQKKKNRELMIYAAKSKIAPNEERPINIPHKNRVCDGKSWPCIVSESYITARLEHADISGYGEGLFVIGDNNLIYDVLRINDLWLIETPLQNRLKFATACRGYDVVPYMKAYSWRSTMDAARIMECNREIGVLVRPCYENYFQTDWFEWSRNSAIYCCQIDGKLQVANRKTSKPDFYTLDGYKTHLSPLELRENEKIWLDDFDIKEFQQILELKGSRKARFKKNKM